MAKTSGNQMSGLDGMWNKTLAQHLVFFLLGDFCVRILLGEIHHETIISRHRLKANLRAWEVNFRINGVIPRFLWEITMKPSFPGDFSAMTLLTNFCIHDHWRSLGLPVIFREPTVSVDGEKSHFPTVPKVHYIFWRQRFGRMFRNFAEFLDFGVEGLLSQWLTFKLFGITDLVGKIKFEPLFHGSLAE